LNSDHDSVTVKRESAKIAKKTFFHGHTLYFDNLFSGGIPEYLKFSLINYHFNEDILVNNKNIFMFTDTK